MTAVLEELRADFEVPEVGEQRRIEIGSEFAGQDGCVGFAYPKRNQRAGIAEDRVPNVVGNLVKVLGREYKS